MSMPNEPQSRSAKKMAWWKHPAMVVAGLGLVLGLVVTAMGG